MEADFFFGQAASVSVDGVPTHSYTSILESLQGVDRAFATPQFNRYLAANLQLVVVTHGTSSPNFYSLLDKIDCSQIGRIEIFPRADGNRNVPVTLGCDLYFPHGILRFLPHWCGWKKERAREIVTSLLVPRHLRVLIDRTLVRSKDGTLAPIYHDLDYDIEIAQAVKPAEYVHLPGFDDSSTWAKYLKVADEVRSTEGSLSTLLNTWGTELEKT
ncbi:hypothetical protein [Zhongshania marina]|uniref:Uncharacterized protein n=1 Tax=Zhongshania marina TaxID=2304603 RepID=A0ABX9W1N4_9GAMM|nr:hypothetical protein D0911_16440 [Zhongshania marina]